MINFLPLGIGQVRLFHMLFNRNPIAAIIVLVVIVLFAIYYNNHR
ncbi:hypothetical protein [uncultured Limosilactobacillus sp.]|nr:hypothetical protein [uncultured Limosilactobacillus sp.]